LQRAIAVAIATPTVSSVAAPHEPFGAIVSTVVGAASNSARSAADVWAKHAQEAPTVRARTQATVRKAFAVIGSLAGHRDAEPERRRRA
jgi:hypothetical protein